MSLQKRQQTGKLPRIVLFISFIILLGRLIYVVPGAIEHHQQKTAEPVSSTSVLSEDDE